MPKSSEGYLWTQSGTVQGLESDAVIVSTPSLRSSYDIIVIGAGFAGLIAARELSRRNNLRILIIEGRDRIGGRTWTAKALGESFEMGGTWVHWNQPHVYSELRRYQLHKNLKPSAGTIAAKRTYYKPPDAAATEVDGGETAQIQQAVAEKFFDIDGLTSRDLMPYPHDPFREPAPWKKYDHLTVRQRLDQLDLPSYHKDLFESAFNSMGSAPGSETGFVELLRWYALGGHTVAGVFELAGIYKIGKGGMTSLARAILKDSYCDILLITTISDITQSNSGVTVNSKNGKQFNAKYIISTIPLNCLSDITFTPPLSPLKREAAQQGHINQGAKIHFKLAQNEPGWFSFCNGYGDSPFCFAFSDHNGTANTASSSDSTYCIGFGYNGHLTDKQDHKTIIREFKRTVKPNAEVEAYLTHDWMNDPLAKGVWSCWGPNSMTKYLQELQVRHAKVLFASADWADGWRGFVDGAIESGQDAAMEVLNLIEEERASTPRAKI